LDTKNILEILEKKTFFHPYLFFELLKILPLSFKKILSFEDLDRIEKLLIHVINRVEFEEVEDLIDEISHKYCLLDFTPYHEISALNVLCHYILFARYLEIQKEIIFLTADEFILENSENICKEYGVKPTDSNSFFSEQQYKCPNQ